MDHLKRPIEIEILGLKKSNKPTNKIFYPVWLAGLLCAGHFLYGMGK